MYFTRCIPSSVCSAPSSPFPKHPKPLRLSGSRVEGGTPGQHPRVFPVGQRAGRFSIQDQCQEHWNSLGNDEFGQDWLLGCLAIFFFFFLLNSTNATGSGLRGKPSEVWRSFPCVLILSLKVFPCLCFVLAAACSLLCPGMRGAALFSRQGVKMQLCVCGGGGGGPGANPSPSSVPITLWLPHRGWGA